MPKGTAINNPRPRLQLPRQADGAPIPFPKSGIFFFPFEQPEAEPKEEGGPSVLAILLMLMLIVGAGIYWFGDNPTIPTNNLAPPVNATTNIRRVEAYELNLRDMPSEDSPVKSILLQGTQVEVLNETQQEFDGDIWVKVRVQTREGLQDGWVNARYLR